MIHIGEVDLPDGRRVWGKISGYPEYDTNAYITSDVEIEWADGTPLTAEEYDIEYDGRYLSEIVTEALLLLPGEPEDDGL